MVLFLGLNFLTNPPKGDLLSKATRGGSGAAGPAGTPQNKALTVEFVLYILELYYQLYTYFKYKHYQPTMRNKKKKKKRFKIKTQAEMQNQIQTKTNFQKQNQ